MKVAIHQPEHLPWLGFFDKADKADVLVLLDHVQFRKNYFQNRNRIRTKDGTVWLTVPVEGGARSRNSLKEVRIANHNSPQWRRKHWHAMQQSYSGSPFWHEHAKYFEDQYARDHTMLCELNAMFIEYLICVLGLSTKVIRSSQIGCEALGRTETLLEICRALKAGSYLSGISGRDYLDVEMFTQAGINVEFQAYYHPIYEQRYAPFIPYMSTVDLLFNHGPGSREIIRGVGVDKLEEVAA